jgi:hypothetical protein
MRLAIPDESIPTRLRGQDFHQKNTQLKDKDRLVADFGSTARRTERSKKNLDFSASKENLYRS